MKKNHQRQQYINSNEMQARSSILPPPISNQMQARSSIRPPPISNQMQARSSIRPPPIIHNNQIEPFHRPPPIIHNSQIEPVHLGEIVGAFNDAVEAYNDAVDADNDTKSQTQNPKLVINAVRLLGYVFFLVMNERIHKYCDYIELHQNKFNKPIPPSLIDCHNSINKNPLRVIIGLPISDNKLISNLRNCYGHGDFELSYSTIKFSWHNGYRSVVCQISANSLEFANWIIALKKEWECKIKTWAKENGVSCLYN